jgi:ubiquinone biosynthesis protein UbiJ
MKPQSLEPLLDDIEEALSRRLGDVAAHRLVGAARQAAALGADAASRLLEGMVEYALEEKRLLVARAELARLRGESESLAARLAMLEERINRLAGDR